MTMVPVVIASTGAAVFVTTPAVTIIAKSNLEVEPVRAWAEQHGFGELLDQNTPIGNLAPQSWNIGDGEDLVEFSGRQCYQSFKSGRPSDEYLRNLIDQGHTSVLEHASISFAVSGVSRTLSHELVRHRVGTAISQESQRYVDAKDIKFVVPPLISHFESVGVDGPRRTFNAAVADELSRYVELQAQLKQVASGDDTIDKKRINEAARSLLPGASETRFVWTANYRTLRHFLDMRGQDAADLEIRRLAVAIFSLVKEEAENVFGDFELKDGTFGVPIVTR